MSEPLDAPGCDLRAWLEPLAPADAARLIAEAREEAERIVRGRLVAAWTDVLLDGLRGAGHPAPRPAPTPADGAAHADGAATAATAATDGVYVHCVVGRDHPPVPEDLEGIEPGARVSSVQQGRLVAIVSPVPLSDYDEHALRANLNELSWLERVARAHERVQRRIARDGTPIPMRLCTIYRDREGVREMLEREQGALSAALAPLAGRTEWGIPMFAAPVAPAGRPAADSPTPAGAGSDNGEGRGASYLHARMADRDERDRRRHRLDEVCLELHERLTAAAVDAVLSAPQRPEASGHRWPMILNGAYLIADDRAGEFDAAVQDVVVRATEAGLDVRRTGPWPPYNFVPGAIGAAW